MEDKNDKTKRLSVYLPEKTKAELERMADETGLSMTQLIVMATQGLLANYAAQGGGIFADLLASRHRLLAEAQEKQTQEQQAKLSMQTYYGARAAEYERIYHREDAGYQRELALVADVIRAQARGKRVLEIACGTGYWSQIAAETAAALTGLDVRPEVLDIARAKPWPAGAPTFTLGDAYDLAAVPGSFDFCLANFWFSHIPRNRIDSFLQGLHQRLGSGAQIVLADNVYVPGRGGELITRPDSEDTYKRRELADGSVHEVLKNYFAYEELADIFKPVSEDLQIFVGSSIWYVSYTVK
ncbi:methyltransferase domain-containing protein [Paenibacillus ferrarius]|uniref:methyltransferase domain-containing protein n=1 Tax=Paenibacillus ferrarius TaxID=1469647 RepID=UPI003D2BC25B